MLTPKCKISILYQSGIHYYMHVQYMYTIVTTKGQTVGMVQNPEGVLVEISQWCAQGIEWSDVIARLRPQTVPSGYAFSSWKPGMPFKKSCNLAGEKDTEVNMLRSILAQMEFCHIVRQYDDAGIPPRT